MFQWGGKVAGEFGRRVGQVPRFIDQRLISFESIRTIIANRKLYNKSQVTFTWKRLHGEKFDNIF